MRRPLLTGIAALFLATGTAHAAEPLPPSCIIEGGELQCWCSLDESCRAYVRAWVKKRSGLKQAPLLRYENDKQWRKSLDRN